ncbi:Predicted O-methyltransferase YrrM [Rhodovulum sp. ES.010]|uniref:class I SAM-dependent methyltransferase n=1 Tax=Rhodovulum sp. ES.010 TaxID=1882821 RepID=UPI0009260AE3|nr:class I SAM-dependent methyltransferase [Rhodovulum sp. ES.010]SIO54319.1 Predicted O-methyltransferase YrrM [Rhodovulum sp. ES.010]
MLGLGLKGRVRRAMRRSEQRLQHLARPRLVLRRGRERVDVVFSEPQLMPMGDRIVLYGLIRGLQPKSYLEIGIRFGGAARIVASAMEANGFGKAVGLDPDLSEFRPGPKELYGRYSTVRGYSPEDIGKAVALLDEPVDFAFIDAVHTYSAAKQDLAGVLPYLADSAHILFHDAFHQGVNQVVEEFLAENEGFHDHGIVSRNPNVGLPVSYDGMRLIRKGPVDFRAALSEAHARAGQPEPTFDPATWDYDSYANRVGNPLGRPGQQGAGAGPGS